MILTLLAGTAVSLHGCAESATPTYDSGGGQDVYPLFDTGDPGDDGGECPEDRCQPGESRCAGPEAVVSCVRGNDGCGSWQTPSPCADGQSCNMGQCQEASSCTDDDGDGYGEGCSKGPDCDDSDPDIHPDASETCGDGKDNNCNGQTDENCQDPCANQPCKPGQMRCSGDRVEVCEHDANGCGTWEGPMNCPTGKCQNGACANCSDSDGDGYGQNCPAGPDCNDNNPDIHEGARELCDNKDNDCDGDIDEDFADLGSSCEVGRGACKSTGTVVCGPNQTSTTCDAMAGSPEAELCGDGIDNNCDGDVDEGFGIVGQSCTKGSGSCQTQGTFKCDPNDRTKTICDAPAPSGSGGGLEICDGKDNDCDGNTDENNVCSTCVEDSYEQDDSSTTGTSVSPGSTVDNVNSCGPCGANNPYDVDWFKLGTHSSSASVTVELSHRTGTNAAGDQYADLDAEFFCGSKYCDAIRGTSGTTQKTLTGTCYDGSTCSDNVPWTIRVYPRCNLNPNGNPPSGTPYEVTRK